jgi:hypothetical protein
MATHIYIVMTTPKAGFEKEFNNFYAKQHVPDVLRVDGFVGCQRLRLASDFANREGASPHVALYEMDTNDAPGAIAEVRRRLGTAQMPRSEFSDPAKTTTFLYEVIPESQ